jgi:glycosyltransferase involved in cell wall biosynthesis
MVDILHVTQPTDAGVARYVTALCADQVARGWRVAVAAPDSGHLANDLARQDIRRLTWRACRSPGAQIGPEVLALRGLLRRVRPNVVHLHSSKAGLAGRLAIRGRVPTLFQPHGWSWLAAPAAMLQATLAWERLAARWTSLYICVGQGEADLGRVKAVSGRFAVIRNGVDLEHFRRADEREKLAARTKLGVPHNVPLAVCVGRVTRQKGQDLLIRAWPAVLSCCPDAQLALVGTGDLREVLRRGAPPGVLFVDPVDDVRPWYAAADVAVLPSRWEGLPLTLLEALSVGRSVVGTDIPGIADALPTAAGTVVPPGDVVALADAISHRLCQPHVARTEGAVGARYAAAEADIRHTHAAVAEITAGVAGWSIGPPDNAR